MAILINAAEAANDTLLLFSVLLPTEGKLEITPFSATHKSGELRQTIFCKVCSRFTVKIGTANLSKLRQSWNLQTKIW